MPTFVSRLGKLNCPSSSSIKTVSLPGRASPIAGTVWDRILRLVLVCGDSEARLIVV